MGFDSPRGMDLNSESLHDPATRAARHLVTLADAIEDVEVEGTRMHARLAHNGERPRNGGAWLDAVRCWNPFVTRVSLVVTCEPHPIDPSAGLVFLLQPAAHDGQSELLGSVARLSEVAELLVVRLRAQVRM